MVYEQHVIGTIDEVKKGEAEDNADKAEGAAHKAAGDVKDAGGTVADAVKR